MVHAPFALENMRYDAASAMVVYRSKMHASLRRNFQLMLRLASVARAAASPRCRQLRVCGALLRALLKPRPRRARPEREAASDGACATQPGSLAIVVRVKTRIALHELNLGIGTIARIGW